MCLDDGWLREVWGSLFQDELGGRVRGLPRQILGPFLLLERTLVAFKELGVNYTNTLEEVNRVKTVLESATDELQVLRAKLNETQKPCENCEVLAKELSFTKKRAKEAEFRVTQIAEFLVVGSSENIEDEENGGTKSCKRKRRCLPDKEENPEAETSINSQQVEVGCTSPLLSPAAKTSGPATQRVGASLSSPPPNSTNHKQTTHQGVSELESSPNSNPNKCITAKPCRQQSSPFKSKSPKIKNVNRRVTRLSRSAELEDVLRNKASPRRNLSADFNVESTSSPTNKSRRSNCHSEKSPNNVDQISSNVQRVNDSLTESVNKCGSELDKLWFGEDDVFVSSKTRNKENRRVNKLLPSTDSNSRLVLANQPQTSVAFTTVNKPNRTSATHKIIKNPDNSYDLLFEKKVPKKKLKQLTLQMKPSSKQSDAAAESEPDDIILPSPQHFEVERGEDEDLESTFAPGVTSTQIPPDSASTHRLRSKTPSPVKPRVSAGPSNRQLDNSFDVVVDTRRTTPSPNYKYKGKTVRGKARAQLQGWDCQECQKFYELACKNQSPSKLKAKMNLCSRHRSKHKQGRPPTPPGFWDLDIPDTPE